MAELEIKDPTKPSTRFDPTYPRIGDVKEGWSISGDDLPFAIGDSGGGTGSVSFSTAKRGKESDLIIARDFAANQHVGKINSFTVTGTGMGVSTDTVYERMVAERTAPPSALEGIISDVSSTQPGLISPTQYNDIGLSFFGDMVAAERFPSPVLWFFSASGFLYKKEIGGGYTVAVTNSNEAFSLTGTQLRRYSTGGSLLGSYAFTGGDIIRWSSSNNKLYVATFSTNMIRRISLTGVVEATFGGNGTGNGLFSTLADFTIDNAGNIYALDATSNNSVARVQKFSAAGTYLSKWGAPSDAYGVWGGFRFPRKISWTGRDIAVVSGREKQYFNTDGNAPVAHGSVVSLNVTPLGGDIYAAYAYQENANFSVLSHATGLIKRFGEKPRLTNYFEMLASVSQIPGGVLFNGNDRDIAYPGWTDSVWEKFKELCSATALSSRMNTVSGATGTEYGYIEISEYNNTEPLDLPNTFGAPSLNVSLTGAAQKLQVTSQNSSLTRLNNQDVVWSSRLEGTNVSIDVGVLNFQTFTVPHSLVSVQRELSELEWQLNPWTDQVNKFVVIDSRGARLPYNLFTSYGGRVWAELLSPNQIKLSVSGPFSEIPGYSGPFNFATPNKEGALTIGGTGVFVLPEVIDFYTGADPEKVSRIQGPNINNVFVSSPTQAYDRGVWAAAQYAGPIMTLSVNVPSVSPIGLLGERYRWNNQSWKVVNVDQSSGTSKLTLKPYTLLSEVDSLWNGYLASDYDSFWATHLTEQGRVYDADVRPLDFYPPAEPIDPNKTVFPATDLFPSESLFPA
jgi:hypothetical protein